jgi:hypothetical protein
MTGTKIIFQFNHSEFEEIALKIFFLGISSNLSYFPEKTVTLYQRSIFLRMIPFMKKGFLGTVIIKNGLVQTAVYSIGREFESCQSM